MTAIPDQLRNYWKALSGPAFALTSLFIGTLIFLNYTIGIQHRIISFPYSWQKLAAFFVLFAFVFCTAWLIILAFSKDHVFISPVFCWLLLCSPLLFAAKVTFDWFPQFLTRGLASPWHEYWSITLNWPLKGLLVWLLVSLLWKWGKPEPPVAGLSAKGLRVKPYFLLLLCMIPLLTVAATQNDFLEAYPKFRQISFIGSYVQNSVPYQLLFELSYGLDFFTIELFFRGFLVLAFVRYAGKAAILPMAAFYCSIHFGKPLFECITSYFGGIILGVIVYHTRSIWGGLIVHLGIAWLMEVAGYVASCLQE